MSTAIPDATRDRAVERTLLVEGFANLVVLVAKVVVGVATSSAAVISDAIHSLADLANNGVAFGAARLAAAPPDREHPYGHRRYETLAVFALATLLAVLAVEIAARGLTADREVVQSGWTLALMLGVLGVNISIALWEGARARRLDSDLLLADARHTLSDVMVTVLVIIGWQLAARGHVWLDSALTLFVAFLILTLAFGLFRRAIPVLVDHVAVEPEELEAAVDAVPGVHSVRSVRSRTGASSPRIDVVVAVEGTLSTAESHDIAEAIEIELRRRFDSEDVTVHIEPT